MPERFGEYVLTARLPDENRYIERFRAALERDPSVQVVLARLAYQFVKNPKCRDWFEKNASYARTLSHRNLRRCIDAGSTPWTTPQGEVVDVPFLVEEHLDAETLQTILARGVRLQPDFAVYLSAAICAALAYLHQQNNVDERPFVYRYLMPENILVTYQGGLKLPFVWSDLSIGYSSDPDIVLLRFNYLSQEQIRGGILDGRSDLFSLGSILYEMLTGREAFPGNGSNFSVLEQIRDMQVAPFEYGDDFPVVLRGVLSRAITKDPAQRYQSASEMEKELRLFLGQQPTPLTRDDVGVMLRLLCGGGAEHLTSQLQEELQRLQQIKWLHPDAKTESMGEDTISWVEARFDEHLAALAPYSVNDELPSPRVEIVRSVFEAKELIEREGERTLSQEVFQWRRALGAVQRRMARLLRCSESARSSKSSLCQEALRAASLPSSAPEQLLRWWGEDPPMRSILEAHFSFLLLFRDKLPSPWAPLIAIWERGAWPITVSSSGLLVYIPVLQDDAVVPWPQFPNQTQDVPPLAAFFCFPDEVG